MFRKSMFAKGFNVTSMAAALVSTAVLTASPAHAYYLGQIDIQKYWCGPLLRATAKATDPGNIYSWGCYEGSRRVSGVDMNFTCMRQYGQPAAAGYTSSRNAYSWYCYR